MTDLLVVVALCIPMRAAEVEAVPAVLAPFVEAGTAAIELLHTDLNRDGRRDYVLVLEHPAPKGTGERQPSTRVLLVILNTRDGFKLAKRSEDAIPPSDCGGPMGDCFQGLTAVPAGFTINEYGGSSWRWEAQATFRYAKQHRTWELVRYVVRTFHVSNPDKGERHVYTKRSFGTVAIEDYDEPDVQRMRR